MNHNLARRIVPCLDVRDGQVVKGMQFRNHVVIGDIIELAASYRDQGADELVFYDITASPEGRRVDTDWVRRVAEIIDIPFCVAGGIRSVADAAEVLAQGADKISINTPALERPDLINQLVTAFGSQCVVIGVDSIATDGQYTVRSHTGTPDAMRSPGRKTMGWLAEVVDRGAGEVVLNCMSADGTRAGYDLEQLTAARDILPIPLVASGGAGSVDHFIDVFQQADVDAALAASVFHSGQIPVPELKNQLAAAGIEVRPC
ncbi:MAG: imidazole glycerol phosphate synthase subunit HisF [Xanthomonadales bacterium]|nr:imidazole glycerol phosphate synthase subunit HisF [Xanthomonadales bacterium]